MQHNFLVCPTPLHRGAAECADTNKFVETERKCGENVGEYFILDPGFWYPKRSPAKNVTTTPIA